MTAMYSAQVRTVGESMARSMTDVHAFKIFMDEPESLGGKNAAPSPLDFILAAHAGCLNYRLCCKPDVGVSQIRTTTVLSSCFCVGQTVL